MVGVLSHGFVVRAVRVDGHHSGDATSRRRRSAGNMLRWRGQPRCPTDIFVGNVVRADCRLRFSRHLWVLGGRPSVYYSRSCANRCAYVQAFSNYSTWSGPVRNWCPNGPSRKFARVSSNWAYSCWASSCSWRWHPTASITIGSIITRGRRVSEVM